MASPRRPSNLIVNYLPQNLTDHELYSMFVTIGPVESSRVMKDIETGYSYGFGFVNYTRPEDAERAIFQLNGHEILNKRIKVSYARPSSEEIKETNLYVTNLPRHYSGIDLENLFGVYGTIVQKNLLLDKLTGFPRGVAFVRFNLREEALEAIRQLDGYIPEGGNEPIGVRVAEEHGKHKAAYYARLRAGIQQSLGGRFNILQGGRGNVYRGAMSSRGSSMRGGCSNNSTFINHLVSYPTRTNIGYRALKQEKLQQRYSPLFFRVQSNESSGF